MTSNLLIMTKTFVSKYISPHSYLPPHTGFQMQGISCNFRHTFHQHSKISKSTWRKFMPRNNSGTNPHPAIIRRSIIYLPYHLPSEVVRHIQPPNKNMCLKLSFWWYNKILPEKTVRNTKSGHMCRLLSTKATTITSQFLPYHLQNTSLILYHSFCHRHL